mgnify:CR=1 FL=1
MTKFIVFSFLKTTFEFDISLFFKSNIIFLIPIDLTAEKLNDPLFVFFFHYKVNKSKDFNCINDIIEIFCRIVNI